MENIIIFFCFTFNSSLLLPQNLFCTFFKAALWDNAELLEDLLRGDQLSNMNSQDSWGRTPLHAAATTENSRCLRVLLQAGGNFILLKCFLRNYILYYLIVLVYL